MKIQAIEERAGYSPEWDSFVETAEGSAGFLSSRWTAAVMRLTAVPVHRLAAVGAGGRILAGLMFASRRRGPVAMARTPWATPYCGPVFSGGLSAKDRLHAGEALASHLRSHYDYARLDTGIGFRDLLAFREGWGLAVRNTYRLERGAGPVSECMSPSARRHLKKLSLNNLTIAASTDPAPLFEMYRDLYARQGRPVSFNQEDFAIFCATLLGAGRASLLYVRDDQPFAGMLVFRWRDTHFYSISAFRQERAALAGPTLLIWHYLENCVAPGESFDFVGANVETPGINAFKRGFNPRECPYISLERRSWPYQLCEPLIRLLHTTRSVAARVGGLHRSDPAVQL